MACPRAKTPPSKMWLDPTASDGRGAASHAKPPTGGAVGKAMEKAMHLDRLRRQVAGELNDDEKREGPQPLPAEYREEVLTRLMGSLTRDRDLDTAEPEGDLLDDDVDTSERPRPPSLVAAALAHSKSKGKAASPHAQPSASYAY